MKPLLSDNFERFYLKTPKLAVEIVDKLVQPFEVKNLPNMFYSEWGSNRITCRFLTPVSFKQSSRYTILPSVHLIFQSLMMKYSLICENAKDVDDNLLEELVKSSEIVQYEIMSSYYKIGAVKIPGLYWGNDFSG